MLFIVLLSILITKHFYPETTIIGGFLDVTYILKFLLHRNYFLLLIQKNNEIKERRSWNINFYCAKCKRCLTTSTETVMQSAI